MKKIISLTAAALLLYVLPTFAGTYEVDKGHSRVGFSIKHMVITNVVGNFTDFSGTFEFDETAQTLKSIDAKIKSASINTDIEKRDNHLRSPDFFDVEKFPDIVFTMKSSKGSGEDITVTGDLTIHGVTKSVTLKGEFGGTVKDPWGKTRAGFSASGAINRSDFGLTWNKALETGGLVVGDKVKLVLEIEGILTK
ncbi:MAG: polyisoprenoid-binding protein [Nitrospinae bacterium]|nr:polyisoprenoid-binding protein [Nitrospinota bacterium]